MILLAVLRNSYYNYIYKGMIKNFSIKYIKNDINKE